MSSAVQTDGRQGMMVASAAQTGLVVHAGCQQAMPVGEGSQTEELEPQWCKHTINEQSQSIVIRKWDTLPRNFVIPGDRFSEEHFANGAYAVQHRSHGPSPLRQMLEATRTKHARVTGFGSMRRHNKIGKTLAASLKQWSSYAMARQDALGELLPASFRIASMRRWRELLAPPPSGSPAAVLHTLLRPRLLHHRQACGLPGIAAAS